MNVMGPLTNQFPNFMEITNYISFPLKNNPHDLVLKRCHVGCEERAGQRLLQQGRELHCRWQALRRGDHL